jgi:hypothetical protein
MLLKLHDKLMRWKRSSNSERKATMPILPSMTTPAKGKGSHKKKDGDETGSSGTSHEQGNRGEHQQAMLTTAELVLDEVASSQLPTEVSDSVPVQPHTCSAHTQHNTRRAGPWCMWVQAQPPS